MNLRKIYAISKKAFVLSLLTLVACGGLVMGWSGVAQATNSDQAAEVVQDRAEREFDRMSGAGTADQIKGKAREAVGKAQRQFGNEVEGTANQVRGKAQQDIGRTKQAADEAEDSAESLVDKAKDFFN